MIIYIGLLFKNCQDQLLLIYRWRNGLCLHFWQGGLVGFADYYYYHYHYFYYCHYYCYYYCYYNRQHHHHSYTATLNSRERERERDNQLLIFMIMIIWAFARYVPPGSYYLTSLPASQLVRTNKIRIVGRMMMLTKNSPTGRSVWEASVPMIVETFAISCTFVWFQRISQTC